jgi:hypothetical protein
MDNFVNVEVDLPDDVFMALAREAHEKNITLNELVCQILREYVDGQVKLKERDEYETELMESTASVVTDGVTVETMHRFARAYSSWFEEGGSNGKTVTEIIQDGFDEADKRG